MYATDRTLRPFAAWLQKLGSAVIVSRAGRSTNVLERSPDGLLGVSDVGRAARLMTPCFHRNPVTGRQGLPVPLLKLENIYDKWVYDEGHDGQYRVAVFELSAPGSLDPVEEGLRQIALFGKKMLAYDRAVQNENVRVCRYWLAQFEDSREKWGNVGVASATLLETGGPKHGDKPALRIAHRDAVR